MVKRITKVERNKLLSVIRKRQEFGCELCDVLSVKREFIKGKLFSEMVLSCDYIRRRGRKRKSIQKRGNNDMMIGNIEVHK